MEQARGRSEKIRNIHGRYLGPWFQRVLNSDEQTKISNLFKELYELDSKMKYAIEDLDNHIKGSATATLNLLDQNNYEGANEHIRNERVKINPMRLAISDTIAALYRLQAEFISVSGAL